MSNFFELVVDRSRLDDQYPLSITKTDEGYYFVANANKSIQVRLRIRKGYPTTFCEILRDGSVLFGYGDKQCATDKEFLVGTITRFGEVRLIRDQFVVLPIFYVQEGHNLVIGNSCSWLVSSMVKPQLSVTGLVDSLRPLLPHRRSLAAGVSILREGEMLEFDTELRVTWPEDRGWLQNTDLPTSDPKDFFKRFNDHFEYFIATRLDGQNFAFEVSGGLDSATLPQYYAKTRQRSAPMYSMTFPGEFKTSQQAKLSKITEAVGGQVLSSAMDNERQFPLADQVFNAPGAHNFSNPHTEVMRPILQQLKNQGVEVVVTGVGGDENFLNLAKVEDNIFHGDIEKERRRQQYFAPFHTTSFKRDYVACVPTSAVRALPLRQESVGFVQLYNNIYLEHDVWPVSPFADVGMYEWCQGLPAQFRMNRSIMRAYHEAHGFVPEVYAPSQPNEHFGGHLVEVFGTGLYDRLIEDLLPGSVSVRLGYINGNSLKDLVEVKCDDYETVYCVYCWISSEINMQYGDIEIPQLATA